ncbi:MAG: Do family serine endopeptidase [Longimicrobiales bacterium]
MAMKRLAVRPLIVVAIALTSACGPNDGAQAQERQMEQDVRERLGAAPSANDTATAARLSATFRNAAARALPSVVYIQVEQAPRTAQEEGGQLPNPFDFFFDVPQQQGPVPPRRGQGSGFIFDPSGYILTNNHVVQDARLLRVTLLDGRVFEAEVVGTDPNSDVAVIKINPPSGNGLPAATFGNSDELRVGDWVIALGNPLGLDFTVTAGIVSAKGRNLNIIEGGQNIEGARSSIEAFIQTDAAINPGNSGGPLVNLLGEVVGINTAIYSQSGFNAGYGFAIPISLAEKIAADLIEYGYVRRPQLGVLVQEITEVDAEVYGLASVSGAEVVQVLPSSPAARAGLQIGDVIVALDGESIGTDTELITRLAQLQPHQRVELSVFRDGEMREISVELGEFDRPEPRQEEIVARASAQDLLGFSATRLTPQLAREFEFQPGRESGVVITGVAPFGTARNAGVIPGMIVLRINGQEIESAADIERIGEDLEPGDAISLVVIPPIGPASPQVLNYRAPR